MKVAVTVSYTKNWSSIAAICLPNMAKYCAKHGYSLLTSIDEYGEYDGLFKIRNILSLLKTNDVVFSFDCDTLITNHNVKLESFIDENDFFVCSGLNMGIFGVKNTPFGYDIVFTIRQYITDKKSACEQDVIEKLMFKDGVKIFEHPAFNSYLSQLYPEIPQPVTKEQGQWEPGCFVLHVPALSLECRLEILKEYSQYIVYE